jgi:pimeloyl-ACP methyl ester carboxylesterase
VDRDYAAAVAFVTVNGVQLAYDDVGSGVPLVLVHGSWTNRHGWARVVPGLADRFRVVRHDRRGHSESEESSGTLDDDAGDIVALAEALELGPFHLVCSSRGGVVGLKVAASRPDLVRSIVCHEPPLESILPVGSPDGGEVEARLSTDRVVELIEAGDHEVAARTFVDQLAFGPGNWERFPEQTRAMFVENAVTFAEEERDPTARRLDIEALRTFPGPALLTTSDDSPTWPLILYDTLAEVLPRSERHVYRGGGHGPQMAVPDQYVEVVGAFLERADA